jgi:hypothetical protein
LLAIMGFLASAASPNPSDHLAGKIIIAIAVGFVVLALYAPPKVTAAIYFGSIALVTSPTVFRCPSGGRWAWRRSSRLSRKAPSRRQTTDRRTVRQLELDAGSTSFPSTT